MRGTPTAEDYAKLEQITGLNSGVVGIGELNPTLANRIINSGRQMVYPNGNLIDDPYIMNRMPYNKVFYDPASPVEQQYLISHGINLD